MLVVIDQSFFEPSDADSREASDADSPALFEIFALAFDERHVIVTRPPYAEDDTCQPINPWLGRLPSRLQAQLRQVLAQGLVIAADLPSDISTCYVGYEPLQWARARLSCEDAARLLRTPLRLLLENRRNDLTFLRRLAPPDHRRVLDEALAKGWIDVHGGGLGEVKKLLEELLTAPAEDLPARIFRLRLWVMFDRDSHPADRRAPSPETDTIVQLCQTQRDDPWPLSFHRLARRSIENYLPRKLLEAWADEATGRQKTERHKRVAALAQLARDQPKAWFQYNMKGGLLKDVSGSVRKEVVEQQRELQVDDLDSLFHGLSSSQRRALMTGFGDKIADLFDRPPRGVDEAMLEQWFRDEYDRGPSEQVSREELLESLFARM
ncbi:MAG: hypothetical protein Tsb0020_35840 [Haliangiales bacterium]